MHTKNFCAVNSSFAAASRQKITEPTDYFGEQYLLCLTFSWDYSAAQIEERTSIICSRSLFLTETDPKNLNQKCIHSFSFADNKIKRGPEGTCLISYVVSTLSPYS